MPADESHTEVVIASLEDKAHTFRKRRLSFPKHHLQEDAAAVVVAAAAVAVDSVKHDEQQQQKQQQQRQARATCEEEEDKAHTFRKRRLSLTLAKPQQQQQQQQAEDGTTITLQDDSGRPAQRRRSSMASTASGSSSAAAPAPAVASSKHKSLTLHSTELLQGPLPPPTPTLQNNILYLQQPAPPQQFTLEPALPSHWSKQQQKRFLNPRWKKRVHPRNESEFPFPKEIVGTYSCHGVEPIYTSEYNAPEAFIRDQSGEYEQDNNNYYYYNDGTVPSNQAATEAPTENRTETTKAEEKEGQVSKHPDVPTMAAKINQDRGGIAFPYGNCPRTALFAVYDGHGQGGELVSQYALHEIQRRLECHPSFPTNLEPAFRETFLAVDESLRHEPIIEPWYAGTTACVALLKENEIVLANAGDSRAVLAQRTDDTWTALDLTRDQNPDSPEEQWRIESMGGFVSAPPGPGLSSRVWLDSDFTQIGLAMARSIGDHAIAEVGVIADPVVTMHTIEEKKDDFMILASDGVWEFLSSQDAVNIVGEHLASRGATKACQALIEAAAARWHDEEGEYRDDITAIVVQLSGLWEKVAAAKQN